MSKSETQVAQILMKTDKARGQGAILCSECFKTQLLVEEAKETKRRKQNQATSNMTRIIIPGTLTEIQIPGAHYNLHGYDVCSHTASIGHK